MSSSPFRWCFIGTGTLANTIAQQILPSGRHQIVSVYSRRAESRDLFAQNYGCTSYDSPEAAISAPDVDGVYIVTPHTNHYPYAKLALELGKPVLCEKPCTVSAKDTQALIQLAEEKQLYFTEAMWTWYMPASHQVKQWLEDGEFGELTRVEAAWYMASQSFPARLYDPMRAGGALLDIGIYPITYLYRLFGKPTKVSCTGILKNGIDLENQVYMTFSNGLTVKASSAMEGHGNSVPLLIEGTKAKLFCDDFYNPESLCLKRNNSTDLTFQGPNGYLNEFDVVAGEIREGLTESPLVPHSATLDVMELLDLCRQQLGLVYPFEM